MTNLKGTMEALIQQAVEGIRPCCARSAAGWIPRYAPCSRSAPWGTSSPVRRITGEVEGVNRVVLDVTPKHKLRGCQAHASHMISKACEGTLKKLGVDVTCTPEFASANLFYT